MDKRKVITILIQLIVLLASCRGQSEPKGSIPKEVDDFYTSTGGWDWIRIPLIKPYEATKVDPEIEASTWTIKFFNSLGPFNIKRVDVKDSVIYLLCGKMDNCNSDDSTLVNLKSVPTGWFVIDARTMKEKGFSSEAEFSRYIRQQKYYFPHWHDLDSLSEKLGKGEQLPWKFD